MAAGLHTTSSAPSARRAAVRRLPYLLVLAAAANLLPVCWFRFLPTTDGPAHVYNAVLMRDLLLGRAWADAARALVGFNPAPVPNWIGHVILAALAAFAGPVTAERLLVAGWVVLFPLSLAYALRAVSRQADALAVLACPFAFAVQFHWGFYNFLLGVCAFVCAVGCWLRTLDRPTAGRWLGCGALALVTYFSSLIGFSQLLLWIAVLCVWRCARDRPRSVHAAFWSALAVAPACAAWAWFAGTQPHGMLLTLPAWKYATANLVRLDLLRSFDLVREGRVAMLLGLSLWLTLGLAALDAWRRRSLAGAEFGVISVLCALAVFLAPATALGGTLLTPREVFFVVIAAALWLAAEERRVRLARPLVWVAAGATAALVALHWTPYAAYDQAMRSFVNGLDSPALARGDVLRLGPRTDATFAPPMLLTPDRAPLSNAAAGYLCATRQLVCEDSYEWRTTHFPLRARADERRLAAGRTPDAIVVWGSHDDPLDVSWMERSPVSWRFVTRVAGVEGRPALYVREDRLP